MALLFFWGGSCDHNKSKTPWMKQPVCNDSKLTELMLQSIPTCGPTNVDIEPVEPVEPFRHGAFSLDTMYYDPAEQRASEFQVLFLAGGHEGHSPKPELFALSSLYFCDSCSKVLCRKDLAEDVDSYYCPHCLENMPSSEAMLCGMRCSKCWECPVCSSTLTPCIANPSSKEPTYHFACSYCRWSSKGKQEADKPESRWSCWVIFRIFVKCFCCI